jgi:hypothetical protein
MLYVENLTRKDVDNVLESIEEWQTFLNYILPILREDFDYQLFDWVTKIEENVLNFRCCYDSLDEKKYLQGICGYGIEGKKLTLSYLSTAPWNYYKLKKGEKYDYLEDYLEDYLLYKKSGVGSFILMDLIDIFEVNEEMTFFNLFSTPNAMKFYSSKPEILTPGTMQADGLREYFIEKFCW